jgi:hypothetical protein
MYMREVDVTGIDNHELNALKLVDAASKIITRDPRLVSSDSMPTMDTTRSIHSSGQFRPTRTRLTTVR